MKNQTEPSEDSILDLSAGGPWAPVLETSAGRAARALLDTFKATARAGGVPPALLPRYLAPVSLALLCELRARAPASSRPPLAPDFGSRPFGELEGYLGAFLPCWAWAARGELRRIGAELQGRALRPGFPASPLSSGRLLLGENLQRLAEAFERQAPAGEAERLSPVAELRRAFDASQLIRDDDSPAHVAAALTVALCFGERASLSQVTQATLAGVSVGALSGRVELPATGRARPRVAELRGPSLDVLRRFLELRPRWRPHRPEAGLLKLPHKEAGYQQALALLQAEAPRELARSPQALGALSVVVSVLERYVAGAALPDALSAELATGRAGSWRPDVFRRRFERSLPRLALSLFLEAPARAG